jgi:ABC-type transport system involved in multi-copper enzyme maturation permease subunit
MILFALARNAFLESIRQPVHAVLICMGLLGLLLNVNVAGYTLEDDNKLLVDLGLSTLFLTGLLMAAFTATGVLAREIENKTVLTVVSKPVARPLVVLGKFIGVSCAIAVAYWLLSAVFLLTVRHRVQSSVRTEDIFDPPVITFGLLALLITFLVSGLANYLYRWSFPATFVVVGGVMATLAWGMVSCVSRTWRLQSPMADFDPQLMIGLGLVFEAIAVLASIAIAASTRLGQIATLLVCLGFFLIGLVGEYFLTAALAGRTWLRPLAAVVPNMQFFWPADALTQGNEITLDYLGTVTLYAGFLVGAAMCVAIILFQRRDVG